jgi:ADP-ribose pyrophosphatase
MQRFNIRVYGILVNDQQQVLLSDEFIRGKYYTKFPGGGLEFGEGTRDCLAREFLEEMNLRVEVGEHIYTTDHFQLSAFHPDHQIVSIYYYAHALDRSPQLCVTNLLILMKKNYRSTRPPVKRRPSVH